MSKKVIKQKKKSKFINFSKDLFKILNVELITNITLVRILVALAISILALMPIFIAENFDNRIDQYSKQHLSNIAIYEYSIGSLITALTVVVTYSFIQRITIILSDKTSLDKNRAEYLHFSEKKVAFSKMLADVFLFILPIIITAIIAPITLVYWKHGIVHIYIYIYRTILFVVSIASVYYLSVFGIRLIVSSKISNKKLKNTILIIWIIIIIGGNIILTMLSGTLREFQDFLYGPATYYGKDSSKAHFFLSSFVPLLNLVSPSTIITEHTPIWTIFPMIFYGFIIEVIWWNRFSKRLKRYLTL